MLLFKCSCGCHFTTKDDTVHESYTFICQNCGGMIDYRGVIKPSAEDENSVKVQRFPDSAKINISFDV